MVNQMKIKQKHLKTDEKACKDIQKLIINKLSLLNLFLKARIFE